MFCYRSYKVSHSRISSPMIHPSIRWTGLAWPTGFMSVYPCRSSAWPTYFPYYFLSLQSTIPSSCTKIATTIRAGDRLTTPLPQVTNSRDPRNINTVRGSCSFYASPFFSCTFLSFIRSLAPRNYCCYPTVVVIPASILFYPTEFNIRHVWQANFDPTQQFQIKIVLGIAVAPFSVSTQLNICELFDWPCYTCFFPHIVGGISKILHCTIQRIWNVWLVSDDDATYDAG